MSFQNDTEAHILAVSYAFNPGHAVYPARIRNTNSGKYEPDRNDTEHSRTIVLAHYADKTNILIKYTPCELITPV